MLKQSLSILTAGLVCALAVSACGDSGTGGAGGEGGSSSTKTTATGSTTKTTGPGPTSASTTTTTTTTTNTASTTTTDAASSTADTSSASGMPGCTAVTWTFTEKQAGGAGLIRGTVTPDIVTAGELDLLQFEFYDDTTGAIDLGAGMNNNYATCMQCARGIADVDGATPTFFFQTMGSMNIDAASTPTEALVNFTSSNITLVEVTIDPNTFESTPVPGGACITVAMAGGDFTTAETNCTDGVDNDGNGDTDCADEACEMDPTCVAPPAWTCDPTFYNRADGCDCECGAVDPDCAIPMADIFNCGDETVNGATCNAMAQCVPGAGWTCAPAAFVDGATCDCACGFADPDCNDPMAPVTGCMGAEVCSAGVCTAPCGDGDQTCDWNPATAMGGISECTTCGAGVCANDTHCGFCDADDTTCSLAEACTCATCENDTFCGDVANCVNDGFCNQFLEGCGCADCAAVPNCVP